MSDHVRSDNGPEFIARAVRKWIAAVGAQDSVHRARQPVGERLLRELRFQAPDELLNGVLYSLAEARIVIESWRQHYYTLRPHSSLGYKPPAQPAILWPGSPSPSNMAMQPTMH